jgi:hypothetical protein
MENFVPHVENRGMRQTETVSGFVNRNTINGVAYDPFPHGFAGVGIGYRRRGGLNKPLLAIFAQIDLPPAPFPVAHNIDRTATQTNNPDRFLFGFRPLLDSSKLSRVSS